MASAVEAMARTWMVLLFAANTADTGILIGAGGSKLTCSNESFLNPPGDLAYVKSRACYVPVTEWGELLFSPRVPKEEQLSLLSSLVGRERDDGRE